VALEIAPLDPAKLESVNFKGAALKVGTFGLTAEMCGDAKTAKAQRHLTLALDPFQEVSVRAIIETKDPAKGKAIAAFQMTDTRDGVVAGGVTIVCTSPPYPSDLPSALGPGNPCPLVLGVGLAAVDPGTDPRSSANPGVIDTRWMVGAPIPGSGKLASLWPPTNSTRCVCEYALNRA
jgi:hypothetical protein